MAALETSFASPKRKGKVARRQEKTELSVYSVCEYEYVNVSCLRVRVWEHGSVCKVCVYVCVYVLMCMCVHVYICVRGKKRLYEHACVCVIVCVSALACVCSVCVCVFAYVSV